MEKDLLLYKAKSGDKWIFGYPIIKENILYIHEDATDLEHEVEEFSLSKKIDSEYYENDVFELRGHRWVIRYVKEICGYNLTREDTLIHFTHYLPLSLLDEAVYIGNAIDNPQLPFED